MIISRTPFRISFAGGGTDFPEFYREESGCVISTTINKYVYLSMHPLFNDSGYHLKYFDNEKINSIDQIKHPIIKEVFKRYDIMGVDFNSSSDVPSGTGLGSSSSFTVGLLNLCQRYQDQRYSKKTIAQESCEIEINRLKSPIGKQDQYAASFGGLNYLQFNYDESVIREPIRTSKLKELENSLMLFYLGGSRLCRSVLTEQKIRINENRQTLRKMVKLTYDLRYELMHDRIDSFGKILNDGWRYKKELSSNITNSDIDDCYRYALSLGAEGGKLLGGGSTGFMLFYAPKAIKKLRANMKLVELPFKFESDGTKIIYS